MTDQYHFHLNDLNSPQFRHLKLLLYWPVFGMLFYMAERMLPRRVFHVMWCPLDDVIPFCEWFLVPYLFWFVFLAGMHLYLMVADIPAFRRMMHFIILTYSAALCAFLLYPSCQQLRPAVFPRDNFLTRFLADFYVFDTNTNVCPSLHCVGSMAVVFAGWDAGGLRRWRGAITATGLLIAFSTVFVKQHSILDVFWGMVLCAAAYWAVYILPGKGTVKLWKEKTTTASRRSRQSSGF